MKRRIALILALLLALSGLSAVADTVYTKIAVDDEAAEALLAVYGVPEERLYLLDTALSLVNALGVNVTTAADGAQVDLDLNGEDALSLGFALDESGVTVASTLFPNYLVTVSNDTIAQMLEQFAANLPAGGPDATALMNTFGKYYEKWFAACAAAGQPGEPESGEYEIDGMAFDTRVPVTVDMAAIAAATQTLMDDLLADPAAVAMLKGCAASLARAEGDADFEARLRAGFEEWMANMPKAASADLYLSSGDAEVFCLEGEAAFEGRDAACRYQMMNLGGGMGYMGYWDDRLEMIAGLEYGGDGFRADFTMGDFYCGLDLTLDAGDVTAASLDVYVVSYDEPLASVNVLIAPGGERTLSLDPAGKTVLRVEDAMADSTGAAAQGLLGDVMMNGLGKVTAALSAQVPEAFALLTGGGSSPTQVEAPKEEQPPVEAHPEDWKTLADVRALDTDGSEATWDDTQYTYIFGYAGTKWAVTAEFSRELQDALFGVDYMADDREAQIDAILGPCKITSVTDIKTLAIPQAELDGWIGKTGQDLLDAGWEYNGYTYTRDGLAINMINGKIEYLVSFEGELEAPQSFDDEPEFREKNISGITFHGNSYHFFD